jgi:hypothetical protein
LTVNVKLVMCESVPDVAVTVTIDMTGCEAPPPVVDAAVNISSI